MKQADLNTNAKLENLKKLYGDKPIEQSANSIIKNNTTSNTHDMARLIDYYRLVLDTYTKEKKIYQNLIDNLKVKNENLHKVEWETKKRNEEKIELERALEESNLALNNERKKAIHFSQMLKNCEEIANDDKRRIGQILQLTEPIEQTIKLQQNCSPEITEKYSNYNFQDGLNEKNFVPNQQNNKNINKNLNNKKCKCKSKSKDKNLHQNININKNKKHIKKIINPYDKDKENLHKLIIKSSDTQQQILRTVIFPEEKNEKESNSENIKIKNEIEEMKKNYDDQIEKLEEIRKIREEDFRQNLLNFKQQSNELLQQNQKLENLNYLTCKDLMELKYDNGIKEKKNYEEMEEIKNENKKIAKNLNNVVQNYSKEKKFNANEYNKKTREMTKNLREQVRAQEEAANLIKEQYKQIQKIYSDRVNDLNEKTKNLIEKIYFLENKKSFLIEGYINEINLMKKRLIEFRNFAVKVGLVSKYKFNKGMNIYMKQFHQKINDDEKYENYNNDNNDDNNNENNYDENNNYNYDENNNFNNNYNEQEEENKNDENNYNNTNGTNYNNDNNNIQNNNFNDNNQIQQNNEINNNDDQQEEYEEEEN
jgi:hypothetical protein